MTIQVRDRNGDRRWWGPDRDITVVYPKVIRQVFQYLSNPDASVVELQDKLGITDAQIADLCKLYAKLISCVELRINITDLLNSVDFKTHPAQPLVGAVFAGLASVAFGSMYGATLHKGEEDPNGENLRELKNYLNKLTEEKPWLTRLGIRIRTLVKLVTTPL